MRMKEELHPEENEMDIAAVEEGDLEVMEEMRELMVGEGEGDIVVMAVMMEEEGEDILLEGAIMAVVGEVMDTVENKV